MTEWPEGAAELFRRATKQRLVDDPGDETLLDRVGVEALLPHRDPFLLVHRVTHVDHDAGRIVARYPLADARAVLAGHFPGHPVYPGALQLEAMGQAAILLWYLGHPEVTSRRVALTHVLGARFLSPVGSDGEIELVVQLIDDGMFTTAVGQCLHHGVICSVAAVSSVIDD